MTAQVGFGFRHRGWGIGLGSLLCVYLIAGGVPPATSPALAAPPPNQQQDPKEQKPPEEQDADEEERAEAIAEELGLPSDPEASGEARGEIGEEPSEEEGEPTTRPARPTTKPATADDRADKVGKPEAQPQDTEIDPEAEARLLEELANIPAEERTYQFSFEDVEYGDLLDAFSRMSGLAILGDPPSGNVTFKTTEVMDFKTAFNRICLLLFKHRENYWMVQGQGVLEVTRMTELPRVLNKEDFYSSVAAFEAAGRDDNDLVMLLYAPETGSVDDLAHIRDYLPDYVRSAPLPDRNVMSIFALVKDIRKFLELVKLFRDVETDDPRVIKAIPVQHVLPSEALESLGALMDLSGSGRAAAPPRGSSRRKGKASPTRTTVSRGINILPDDAQQVLIVKALPSDIEEIEELLPFIDVPLPTDFEYEIIPLKHVTTAQIMDGLRPLLQAAAGQVPAPEASGRKKGKQPRRSSRGPGAVAADDVTVVPEPRTNKLIVIGTEEGKARVREFVALLDVESDGDLPTIVKLEHAEAASLVAQITPIVQQIHPQTGKEPGFTATPDQTANSLILLGTRPAVELAEELIAQWDVEGVEPTLHKIRPANARPSDVANMLSRVESGQPKATPPRSRSKKGAKRPTRSRGVSSAGKFISDDATGMLYVLCTDEEWNDKYLPLIEEIDQNAVPVLKTHMIAVEKADPQTVIDSISGVLGRDPQQAVTMQAVPGGIMVVNATETEIEQIEQLVPVYDVDPDEIAGLERRIFEIEHAAPSQVRDVILTMMSSTPVRIPRPSGEDGKKRRRRRPTPAAGADIRIVEVGRSLIITAPAEKMPDIEELIAQVDVEEGQTEIRSYPFPPGVNVQELATTLSRLHGGTVSTRGKGEKRAPRKPITEGITFIAQPSVHQLIVSAPVEEFEEIEKTIALLGTEPTTVQTVYEFIDVEYGDAATIVSMIDPMLKAKLSQVISSGDIPTPEGRGTKGAPPASLLTIQADPRGDRIIIAAPELIVAEAKSLAAALDRPDDQGERVIRTVMLEKTDPEEMTRTIQSMLTGRRTAPVRPGGKGRPSRPVPAAAPGQLDVTVTSAPGGGAVVLMGIARDVEQVEGWIKQLDETATGSGKIVKMYDLREADPEQVVNTLMAVVDSGAGKMAKPPKRKSADEFDFDFSAEITRQGKDLYISANKFAGTMLVAATPAKMREVDEMVQLFVGTDEEDGIIQPEEVPPYMTFELKSTEAFDAVFTLEAILDAVWVPADDKPSVDYIPFTNILVVKGPPERFKEVEDLIREYVDKGTGKPPVSRSINTAFGSGMTAADLALLLKGRLESLGLPVDIEQLYPEHPVPTLEEVHPCMLPPCLFAGVQALTVDEDSEQDPAKPAPADEAEPAEDEPADSTAPPPTATLRIRFDDKTGVIYLEGSSTAIEEAEELIETIKEEAKDVPAPPDIRIYRLKYVDVNQAAEVLETMFNDRQLRAQQQQIQRMQQQMQRQRQRQQQQQGKGQPGQPGQRGQQPGQQQQPQMPQLTVRVYPNPRARTIIVRAATELFPSIVDLLATIDRKATEPLDYKIFTLQNLVAADVEAQIKEMLGLGRSRGGTRRRPGRRPGQRAAPQQGGQQGIIQMELPGGESGSLSTQDITVSSNAATNTVMVMAPKEAMELVERFINDMEALQTPTFVTKTYELQYADAGEVVPQVEKLFKGARGRGGAGGGIDPSDVNDPMFMADARTNSIIVRALEIDLPKIEPLIQQLDVEAPADEVVDYVLVNADAVQVAKTLTQLFGKPGAGRGKGGAGAKAVKIIGEPESNVIFVTAPPDVQKQIAERIAKIEEEAGQKIKPRVIKVALGTPSEIADKITEALGGGKGRGKSRIQIMGDDAGKQLIVRAPEQMMPQIESLVAVLDQDPAGGLDIKIYPLQYAQAKETLQGLNQLVKQIQGQLRGSGVKVDIFSASADERSNSLVVMGGPMTFMLVEKVLKDLDVPPRDPTQVVTMMFQLTNVNATDLARNINNIYKGRREKGVDPPRAEANPSTNTLIVRGTKAQVEEIQKDVIDPAETMAVTTAEELKDERIPLLYAKADEVAQLLTEFFNNKFRAISLAKLKNIKPPELTVSITAEVNSNSLLVTASDTNMALIKELLPEIDREDIGTKSARTPEIYTLTYADAGSVANAINSAFRVSGRQAERDRVQAVVEWATQSVVVIASAENQEGIRTLIEQLDQDTGTATQIRRVYRLDEARASDVARIIDQTLRGSRQATRKGRMPVSVVANDALNSLVIAGSQKEYDDILPLIQELDQQPTEITGLAPRVYVLKFAEPGSTIGTIQSAFPRLPGQRPEDNVRAAYAGGTASLVVSANAENHEKVKKLLDEIDVESTTQRTVHLIELEFANADDLANKLGQLFGRTTRRQRDQQPISFTSEPGSNRLMVYANEKEMEQITPLIRSLDVRPEFEKNRIFKSFKLTYAESWGVKQLIDDSFRVRGGRGANPRDMVTCMAEWGSNSLVVTASPERMEQVEKLIAEVDQKGTGQREVRVVPVKHADPAAVNQALNEIFVRGARGRRGGETISVSNPRGSDTLLIRANETEFAEIQRVIEQLDTSESEIGGEIQVIPLKYTDAGETLEILQEYLRKPGGRGAELAGDMRISAATATNSLVISGDPEEIEHLSGIVAKIDVEIEDDAGAPKIIKLQYARASEIEESLTTLFSEGGRGGRRGGRRGGGSATMTPTIVADDGTNSLIVRASAVDFKRIEELVAQLDTEDDTRAPKVIRLEYAQASDIEESLNVLFGDQGGGRGRRGRRGASPTGPVIVGDDGTNSLIVRASAVDFKRIEELVAELDQEDAVAGTPKIIRLQYAQASEIEPKLTDLFAEQRGRGGRSRGRGGAATMTPIIVADDGTNSLIVRASAADCKQIESLVTDLDTPDAKFGLDMKIVTLKPGVSASEMADMLDEILEQQERGGRGGRGRRGGGSQTQRVLVRADVRTNSLILTGPHARFAEIEELVRDLEGRGPRSGTVSTVIQVIGDPEEIAGLIEQVVEETKSGSSGKRRGGRRRR